ncbi:hypothetical protein H6G97_27575 [Nostoc flagelliforme FACHB-838]|uniref:Uncharacterized protein n=1 Tax=Nostoc flagelliforme FACHB-838 TaxID=2692904 RepID=A0ABR8DXZ0_9NOSO|nr:hypothetical protein [Nostoc flagelliforme]MBD2533130.1 hypothetical protein [Nostoc flagelliforme FACHB-838]
MFRPTNLVNRNRTQQPADSDVYNELRLRNLLRRLIHGKTLTQQDKSVIRKLTRREILTTESNSFQVPLVQKYIEQLLEE